MTLDPPSSGPGAADGHDSRPRGERREVLAHAELIGQRIDTRGMEQEGGSGSAPVVAPVGKSGRVVLFRHGVVVFFAMNQIEQALFLDTLAPRVVDPLKEPERDDLRIIVATDADEIIDSSGRLILRELKLEHMQLIAEAMAKSLVLARYESNIGSAFDRIEPLALKLKESGRAISQSTAFVRHLGDVMLAQQHMVGHVAISERPDVLWDHPRLERLYARLEDWYELIERDRAIDRKLDLISRTAETLNDLLQHQRSLRVEWYIVILIVIEIILTLYQMASGMTGH